MYKWTLIVMDVSVNFYELGKNSYPDETTWNHLMRFDWEIGSISKVVENVKKRPKDAKWT